MPCIRAGRPDRIVMAGLVVPMLGRRPMSSLRSILGVIAAKAGDPGLPVFALIESGNP